MFEKRTHQFWILADFGELGGHALIRLLSLLQRAARIACTLGVAPHPLIRIQFGR